MTDRNQAPEFIQMNFRPTDRLAVVLLNQRTHSVIQRLAPADTIAAGDFQAWLHCQNARRSEVYLSMNALADGAKGWTKADIAAIRHLYLDFDENGTEAVDTLLKREDLPRPNYLVNTSPGKWQVLWKVDGFGKDQAEELQRHLVRDLAADPAATDCARVMRLPGFYNHKYARPHLIRAEALAVENSGVMTELGSFRRTVTGTPQGGIFSPLAANIYLNRLDAYFTRKYGWNVHQRRYRREKGMATLPLVRFADDFVILVNGTREQAESLKQETADVLRKDLCMELSLEKTRITSVTEGFDFLVRPPYRPEGE